MSRPLEIREHIGRMALPDPEAWKGLGALAAGRGDYAAAVEMTLRALAATPDDPGARLNLGIALLRMGRLNEAREALAAAGAVATPGTHWRVVVQRGNLATACGNPVEAAELFQGALHLAPETARPIVENGLADARLRAGDFLTGFAGIAPQWGKVSTGVWSLGLPEWDGDPASLRHKRLLVHHHQGYGDTIQFVRLLRDLPTGAAANFHSILAVPGPLIRLLGEFGDLADLVVDLFGPMPEGADLHCPLSLLPAKLRLTIDDLPGRIAYLDEPPCDIKIPAVAGRKIGIIWSADQRNPTGPARSVPLEAMLPLCRVGELYGLQQGGAAEIEAIGAGPLVHDLGWAVRDFADLAGLMAQMDLIVSADTAPLHLAGALGLPCVGLLSTAADWRWLTPDRDDSPWYPTMQLVRQRKAGQWEDGIARAIEVINGL